MDTSLTSVDNVMPDAEQPLKQKRALFYTPVQIGLASMFGTLLAGFICMALNYRVAQNRQAMLTALLFAAVLVPLSVAAFAMIPDTPFDRLWPIGSGVVGLLVARLFQGKILESAFNDGANRKSLWRVSGVVVISLLIMFSCLMAVALLFDVQLT